MAKEFLAKGALCMCKFGASPGRFTVLDQSYFYVNGYKLAGTTLSLGNTFEPPGFGVCKVNPIFSRPCTPAVVRWAKPFTAIKTSKESNPLTDESTATCATGAPDCITVVQTGQIPVPGLADFKKASAEHQADLDPTGESAGLDEHQIQLAIVPEGKFLTLIRNQSDLKSSTPLIKEIDNYAYSTKTLETAVEEQEDNSAMEEDEEKQVIIAIDPGHGDHHNNNRQIDPGAVNGMDYEKDYALKIANSLHSELMKKEIIKVIMTRTSDVQNAGIQAQWRLDKAVGSEMFVSIHLNASSNPTANGFEVLYKAGCAKSQSLANCILESNTLFRKRSTISSSFHVLRNYSSGPSVIVEAGFISNSNDLTIIKYQAEDIAAEIAKGIFKYLEL